MDYISTYRAPKAGLTEKVQTALWQLWTGKDTAAARMAGLVIASGLCGLVAVVWTVAMAAAGAR